MSQKLPSWRVYFFPTERERERKRESLSSGASSSASWRRWWPIVDNLVFELKPVFLSFCLFWREFVIKNMFWAYLWWKKKYAERGRSLTSLVFLPSFRILSCETFVVSARIQRRWWPQNSIYLKLPGVFDHSKCSEPKNLHPRYFFFFDPLAHAVFFTHTQKHTHRRAQETQFSLKTCRLYRTQAHFMVTRCVVLIVDDDKKRISPPPPKRTSIGRSASRRGWWNPHVRPPPNSTNQKMR